jgi:uncharacterized membrane protein
MYMAKAVAAFVGTLVTALFAAEIIPTVGVWHTVLTVASILATAVTTYAVPNRPATPVP